MTRTDSLYEHLVVFTTALILGLVFQSGCTPPVAPSYDAGDGGGWAITCLKIQSQPGFIRNSDGTPYMPNCDSGAP